MAGRNEVFQKLKPPCVALSQEALRLQGSHGDIQILTSRLETLQVTLLSVGSQPHNLDSKLAEYVFFPIAQVLKASQKISLRCLELCLQCITVLVNQGWRKDMPIQLAVQLTILSSSLAEKQPRGLKFSESTDELQASAFRCLCAIFAAAGANEAARASLTNDASFPQLGQTITVMLDGIHDGKAAETQIAATEAMESFIQNVSNREINARFLPGITSKLTKVLTPQTKMRRNPRVLIGCLDIVGRLLRSTLANEQSTGLANGNGISIRSNGSAESDTIIDREWRTAAAEQLKPAFSNIFRLKAHSRDDVKDTLSKFCLMLLEDCSATISGSLRMALETLLSISAATHGEESIPGLDALVRSDHAVSNLLQNLMYDWLQSLPTIMQGADEQSKMLKLRQIVTAYGVLGRSGTDTITIDRLMAQALRDSVVIIAGIHGTENKASPFGPQTQSLDMTVINGGSGSIDFNNPLAAHNAQGDSLSAIENLIRLISSSNAASAFATDLSRMLRQSQGGAQIASFWLMLTATESAMRHKDGIEDLLNFETSNGRLNDHLEELYSFSLSILTESSGGVADLRLQRLALRGLALRAQAAGQEFRYELVDALYPVLHTLATPDERLQRDSITTLNILASTCGYNSVSDLVIENVDYLTNAIALKLNAFDVSPQAPQVLLMMVRLAGPKLLPYLEDTIDSIFAALEDYHGYPLLVELLFKVLGVMAEEGAKAPQLLIERSKSEGTASLSERWEPASINGLAVLLQEHTAEEKAEKATSDEVIESHPMEPWKESYDVEDSTTDGTMGDDQQELQMDNPDVPLPAAKTYNLLFKITELTQHFLPSASPSLRISLLSLIRTTVPAIAKHENSFLPLINTLWPEIVSRLEDEETHVIANALGIVGVLCEYAGNFMQTRIIQLWPRLVEIYRTTAGDIVSANLPAKAVQKGTDPKPSSLALIGSGPELKQAISTMHETASGYGDTATRLIWASLTLCLTAIIKHVRVTPDLFDEALEMLESVLAQETVRSAFERENADAVWLVQKTSDLYGTTVLPRRPDDTQWRFAAAFG